MSAFTVLVVEDEPLVRMDMADHLSDAGYKVIEAAHAAQAMKVLEGGDEIHLLLTDVDMPGEMDGLKLASVVADRWPPIRIIVVSGHRVVEDDHLPTGGMFFPKPYSPHTLEAAMHNLLV